MRSRLLASLTIGLFLVSFSTIALTQPTDSLQPIPFLRRSHAVLTAGVRIKDVTLNGTATYYGSNTEWGNIVLTAVGVGQSLLDVTLPSGERTETRTLSNGVVAQNDSGQGGAFSTFGFQAATIPSAWFFPAYALAPGLAASGYVVSYVGHETRQNVAVDHLTISQQTDGGSSNPEDVYLDSSSHLPVAIAFNLQGGGGVPPVQIQYLDYEAVNGRQVPYHVQVYVQSTLLWDIQLSSHSINTGVTITPPSH